MNPIPKNYGGTYFGPAIGEPQRDGPIVVEVPGYGVDHSVTADNTGAGLRGYRPATVVVDGSGYQQLGGFLSFEELDNALGNPIKDDQRKFAGQNVVIDANNKYYLQPKVKPVDPLWENPAAGLKELMLPPRKKKPAPKIYQTPTYLNQDGLSSTQDPQNPQRWKLIQPGKYWPPCFPLITIRKPVLIPEHSETKRLQTTLPVQVLQKVPKNGYIVDQIHVPNPELAKPIKGELTIPGAMIDNRNMTLAAATMNVPLQAQLPSTYGTMQIPLSNIQVTQQHQLQPTWIDPGHNRINSYGPIGDQGYSA